MERTADTKRRKKRAEKPELAPAAVNPVLMNKVRFIANHRRLNHDEVFDAFGGPGINAEFDRCVKEANAPARRA